MRLAGPSPAGVAPDLPALLRALAGAPAGRVARGGRALPVSAAALSDLAKRLSEVEGLPPFQLLYETPLVATVDGAVGAEPFQVQIGADGAFRDARWHGFVSPRAPREVLSWLASVGVPEPLARYERWLGPEGDSSYSRFVDAAPLPFQPIARAVRHTPVGAEVAAARAELEKGSGVGGFLRRVSGAGQVSAMKALLEWYGAEEGPLEGRPPYQELPRMALSGYGLQEVLDVFARLSDPAGLRGAGRYILVPEVAPSMLAQYAALPQPTREAMVAAWGGSPADAARLRERLFPGSWAAPAGTALVLMSQSASFRSVAARGRDVVAIDNTELVKVDARGGPRAVIARVPVPGVVAFVGEEIALWYSGATRFLDENSTFLRSEVSPAPPQPAAGGPWNTESIQLPGEPGHEAATADTLVLLAYEGDSTRVGRVSRDGSAAWSDPLPIPREQVRQVVALEGGALLRLAAGAGEALVRVDRWPA